MNRRPATELPPTRVPTDRSDHSSISIRRRLLLQTTGVALATLIAFGAATTVFDSIEARGRTIHDMGIRTENIALNASAAVEFGDAEVAQELLDTLRNDPRIIAASISDLGMELASFGDAPPPPLAPAATAPEPTISGLRLTTSAPILAEGLPIGSVTVIRDLSDLREHLIHRLALGGIVLVVAMAIAGLLAAALQRRITAPLEHLAEIAQRVTGSHEGSLRATKFHDDEIGGLTDAINTMLGRIERRDAELARHRDELELLIAERTADLVEAKLAAEASNDAKSQFLANMSHEIRTPMTAILGYADLLLDPEHSADERADCVRTIQRNGKHLIALINDILDLTKIEAGKMTVERVETDPWQILDEVGSLMLHRADEKGITLVVENRTPLPTRIASDPTRLRQILVNLVGNAVKFTEAGEVRVEAILVDGESDAPRLHVEVTDTGIGMSPEQASKLFRAFTQADETMTRRFGGTGLGLAISRHLAELLGGTIEVASTLGEGSTFTLVIPCGSLQGVEIIASPEGKHRRATTEVTAVDTLERRILLAEDGPDNQKLISFLLERAGAEVTIVGNGRLAVEAALAAREDESPFDVILMDMQMPELDGYGAARELRGAGYPGPIIALTAHAMTGDREQCLAAGCTDYLTKPVDREALIAAVARATQPDPDRAPARG